MTKWERTLPMLCETGLFFNIFYSHGHQLNFIVRDSFYDIYWRNCSYMCSYCCLHVGKKFVDLIFFSLALTEVDNICRGKVDSWFRFEEQPPIKRCPYSDLFGSVFSRIWSISPYSVRMRENTDQDKPKTDTFHAVLRSG